MECCVCTDAEGGVARIRGWLVREPEARQRQQPPSSTHVQAQAEIGIFFLSMVLITNKRKAKMENTKPNSQKALGSLTSTVVDVGAHSVIYVSPPESSIEITVARIVD